MPLLWKTLLYTKTRFFLFTLVSSLCLLFVSRASEVAKIAVMCQSLKASMFFMLLHLPIFLPLSLPIAALASSYLLQKQLLENRTFFALLSSGVSFMRIYLPILLLSSALSIFNFFCISELATLAWHKAKNLPHQFAKKDPIQLVLYKIQEESTGVILPKYTADRSLIFFAPNNKKRIASAFTKNMHFENGKILIDDVDTLTYVEQDSFDHIFIENKQNGSMEIAQNLQGFLPKLKNSQLDYFSLSALFKTTNLTTNSQFLAEFLRRIFWGFCVFNCSIAGLSLAMISLRKKILLSIMLLFAFAALFFATSFIEYTFLSIFWMTSSQLTLFLFGFYPFFQARKGAMA